MVAVDLTWFPLDRRLRQLCVSRSMVRGWLLRGDYELEGLIRLRV